MSYKLIQESFLEMFFIEGKFVRVDPLKADFNNLERLLHTWRIHVTSGESYGACANCLEDYMEVINQTLDLLQGAILFLDRPGVQQKDVGLIFLKVYVNLQGKILDEGRKFMQMVRDNGYEDFEESSSSEKRTAWERHKSYLHLLSDVMHQMLDISDSFYDKLINAPHKSEIEEEERMQRAADMLDNLMARIHKLSSEAMLKWVIDSFIAQSLENDTELADLAERIMRIYEGVIQSPDVEMLIEEALDPNGLKESIYERIQTQYIEAAATLNKKEPDVEEPMPPSIEETTVDVAALARGQKTEEKQEEASVVDETKSIEKAGYGKYERKKRKGRSRAVEEKKSEAPEIVSAPQDFDSVDTEDDDLPEIPRRNTTMRKMLSILKARGWEPLKKNRGKGGHRMAKHQTVSGKPLVLPRRFKPGVLHQIALSQPKIKSPIG